MIESIFGSKKIGTIIVTSELNNLTIRTSRLILRSLNQIDYNHLIEEYTNLLTSPDNVELFGEGKPWDTIEVKNYIESEIKKWNDGELFGVFAVYNADSQKFMGSLHVNFVPYEFAQIGSGHEHVAELSYVLDKPFWGAGYGTEIAIAGKKYTKFICEKSEQKFSDTLPKEIVATVHPLNLGSKKILEKTLKNQEEEPFIKFNGQPRILFFKPLKQSPVFSPISTDLVSKL